MNFNQIRIVLVRPSHPGNIGAVARAMKNMGFTDLLLVAPEQFPSEVATARASGAESVLINAKVHDRLDQALHGCHYVVTTTARQRSLHWENYDARKAAKTVKLKAELGPVAMVFGPERTGLTNEEISYSHSLIHIPTDNEFPSMNLAAAVMLVCYELRICLTGEQQQPVVDNQSESAATAEQVDGVVNHLQQVMLQVGYLTNKPSNRLMRRVRRLFNRSSMSEQDVNILRGILAGIQSRIK